MDRFLSLGLDAKLLVPEERDISLPERCRRDRWYDATGWCAYTTPSLTENLFMGNPSDSAFHLTKEGQQSLVDLHVDGILYCPGL